MDLPSLRCDAILCAPTTSGVYDVRDVPCTVVDLNTGSNPSFVPLGSSSTTSSAPAPARQLRSNIRRYLNRPKRMVTFKMQPCVAAVVNPKSSLFQSSSSSDNDEDFVGGGVRVNLSEQTRVNLSEQTRVNLSDKTKLDVSRYRLLVPLLLSSDKQGTSSSMSRSNEAAARDVTTSESSARTSCELDDSGVGPGTSDGSEKTDDSSELELFRTQGHEHRSSCESMPSESESVFLPERSVFPVTSGTTSRNLSTCSPNRPPVTPPRRTSSCSKQQHQQQQQQHGSRNENGRLRTRRAVPRMGTRLDYRKLGEDTPRSRVVLEPHYDEAFVGHRQIIEEGQYEQPWTSFDPSLTRNRSSNQTKPVNGDRSKNRSKPVVEEGFYEEPWGRLESNVVLDKYRIDGRQMRKQQTSTFNSKESDIVNIPSSNQENKSNYFENRREISTSIEISSSDETPSSSSSAYNTGDSCCSTPLASPDQHANVNATSEFDQNCSTNSRTLCDNNESTLRDLEDLCFDVQSLDVGGIEEKRRNSNNSSESLDAGSGGFSDGSSKGGSDRRLEAVEEVVVDGSLQQLYTRYADVMYTNRENLEHTMRIQQSLFEQQLNRNHSASVNDSSPRLKLSMPGGDAFPYRSNLPCDTSSAIRRLRLTDFENNNNNNGSGEIFSSTLSRCQIPLQEDYLIGNDSQNIPNGLDLGHLCGDSKGAALNCVSPGGDLQPGEVQMEWVIKRRGDGTRYVTRRPVKKQLLRERAQRVAEQRCGMTTDDDVRSELKVGRYWPKDERRRQLEQARSDRKQRDIKVSEKLQRMETVGEGGVSGLGDNNNRPNIVEMSRRKMEHHKRKRGGALDDFLTVKEILAHGSQGAYKPLLSVTTV